MAKDGKPFEKLNHRIHRLLQGTGAKVEWNVQIPDPDSGNPRQIDVLITSSDGKRSSVECRDHAVAQSVKWIEELEGRRQSLGLDGMIGVSIQGFSTPAITKATRFGILLYDFDRLTDEEIASWGSVLSVESDFVQFAHLEILAAIPDAERRRLGVGEPVFLQGTRDGYAAVLDALRNLVAAQPNTDQQHQLNPAGFSIDGIPVTFLNCAFKGAIVTQVARCTYAAMVDEPGTARRLRTIGVHRFEHSVNEVVQNGADAHLQIDVSQIHSPPNSILHETRVLFSRPTQVSRYELIGGHRLLADVEHNAIALKIVTMA